MQQLPCRSLLFVPGDSERKIEKSQDCQADILIFDLEDSVPASGKPAARKLLGKILGQPFDSRKFVRVNGLNTGLIDEDLDAIMHTPPEAIVLPKCESQCDIQRLSDKLDQLEADRGHAIGTVRILPVATETARAVRNLMRSDWSHPRLTGLTWGAEDIAADIGSFGNRDENGVYTGVYQLARDICLLAAREARVNAIDTAFVDFKDQPRFAAECAASYKAGFDGKIAIHPAQVPTINKAFTPSEEQAAWARQVIALLDHADNGVAELNGQMIDMPHRKNAERILRSVVS